jgi:hypothetical protein
MREPVCLSDSSDNQDRPGGDPDGKRRATLQSNVPPNVKITPEPCRVIWRAAAREVRNLDRTAVSIGRR